MKKLAFVLVLVIVVALLAGCTIRSEEDMRQVDKTIKKFERLANDLDEGTVNHREFEAALSEIDDELDSLDDLEKPDQYTDLVYALEEAMDSYQQCNGKWQAQISNPYQDSINFDALEGDWEDAQEAIDGARVLYNRYK